MSFQDIQYLLPQAGYCIFLIFMIIWLFKGLQTFRQDTLEGFASPNILSQLLQPKRSNTLFWMKCTALCASWALAIIALMQPMSYGYYPNEISQQAKPQSQQTAKHQRKAQDLILLIDASASMTVADARNGKTRLDFSKEIADALVSELTGQFVGLYAFTSDITQLSPPTLDYFFVRMMIQQIQVNEGGTAGTDFTRTLQAISRNFLEKPSPIPKTLFLLTDGEDTKIEALQGPQREKAIEELLMPLKNAASRHFKIYSIGIGSRQPSPIPGITFEGKPVMSAINEGLLKKISQVGRGRYYFANDFTPRALAAEMMKVLEEEHLVNQEETKDAKFFETSMGADLIHDLYFQIPLGLAIFLLATALILPDSRRA